MLGRIESPGPCDVSRETRARLDCYAALLQRWNRGINLIAGSDLNSLWPRHIADSLQLAPLIGAGDRACLDIGSGAGFPGLILAIVSGRHFHLVESDRRKAAFLVEASRVTGAQTTVHADRVEVLRIAKMNLITARAVAPLPKLLELAVPHLTPDGTCLFLKGRTAEQELVDAQKFWHMTSQRLPSRTDPDGCVLKLSEISRVEHHKRPQ